ncbi:MAG: replication initiator protein A [Deltaproteobacteria bacterium]|nr:replication initiator protein A [Deltaproteobacteria bacterium]
MEKLEDILTRFEKKITAGQNAQPQLPPDRYAVRDFFVADILDWALKDDLHSMEHPLFSLSKKPQKGSEKGGALYYEHDGNHVTIKWGTDGRATIWDKDVLIYAVSQLMEAANQGRPLSRTVRLTAYDLLKSTQRHTGGKNYELLKEALARLTGTRIETNIATNGLRIHQGFGLLDNWKIVKRADSGQMILVELTLNEWLYNAVLGREVLTLNRKYFQLDGGLERRLYELARKHCGRQTEWTIGLPLLHSKSGSSAPLKKFRQHVKRLAEANDLPDYLLSYDPDTDRVTFRLSVH